MAGIKRHHIKPKQRDDKARALHRIARDKARVELEALAYGVTESGKPIVSEQLANKAKHSLARKQKRALKRIANKHTKRLANEQEQLKIRAERKQAVLRYAYEAGDTKLIKQRAGFHLRAGTVNLENWYKP